MLTALSIVAVIFCLFVCGKIYAIVAVVVVVDRIARMDLCIVVSTKKKRSKQVVNTQRETQKSARYIKIK